MFEESKTAISLSEKIQDLLLRYKELKDENERLSNELMSAKALNEVKDAQILKLEDDLRYKALEDEDICGKIEAVLLR